MNYEVARSAEGGGRERIERRVAASLNGSDVDGVGTGVLGVERRFMTTPTSSAGFGGIGE